MPPLRHLPTIAGLAACAAATTLAAARPTNDPIQPTYLIDFSDTAGVSGVVVAPAGDVAYVNTHVNAIDLWGVATHYWPEAVGAAGALLLLAAIAVTIRIARRPQRRGLPYCRRCNYDLREHATARDPPRRGNRWHADPAVRCPECGVPLTRRAIKTGRRLKRRLAPAWLAVTAVLAAYVALFLADFKRADPRLRPFSCRVIPLAGIAKAFDLRWLNRHTSTINRIEIIDLTVGSRAGELWRGGTASHFPPSLTPCGEYVLVADGFESVLAISTRSGRLRARLEVGLDPGVLSSHRPVLAQFPDDKPIAYIYGLTEGGRRSTLLSWDLRSGQVRVLVDSEPNTLRLDRPNVPDPVFPRRATVARVNGSLLGAVYPRFVFGGDRVLITNLETGEIAASVPVSITQDWRLHLSRHGHLYGIRGLGDSFRVFDLHSRVFTRLGHEAEWTVFCHDRSQSTLFRVASGSVRASSMQDRQPLAAFAFRDTIPTQVSADPCDRWLAVLGTPWSWTPNQLRIHNGHHIAFFDLTPLRQLWRANDPGSDADPGAPP